MIKASIADKSLNLKPLIDNYSNYILNKEYRLDDGTFARKRPQKNTVWLDDMFMGIPRWLTAWAHTPATRNITTRRQAW